MASFYIPLTGLNADSTALNTIANDLSNMNTTGYKSHTVNFSDLFSQQLGSTGSGDPLQVGAGTQVASITTDFSNGSPDSTGVDTNVAIQGNGFFVVSDGQTQYLTRAGNFAVDATGNMITPNGLKVMGYPATNGVINTNAPIAPINIPESEVLSPSATSTFNIAANLDSTSALNATFPATVNIYDSLGQMHTATVTFKNTGVNQWSYSIQVPAADTGGVAAPVNGSMTFDASGNLATVNGTAVGTGAGQVSTIAVAIPGLTDQAANLNMSWNLMGAGGTPTISQVASQSAVEGTTQNGYASGQYQGFSIGSDGTVTVTFSNEQKLNVGQIALGNVANLQGLRDAGNSDYATTMASGTTTVGVSGSAGLGTMQDGALEASNVNISAEFSNLIIAQRAFEANSKSITTFDTITQETIQMIH
jgi:flagellar hook protein FlgE